MHFRLAVALALVAGFGCSCPTTSVSGTDAGEAGAACTEHAQCTSGICENGVCAEPASDASVAACTLKLNEACTPGGTATCCEGACLTGSSGSSCTELPAQICKKTGEDCASPTDCCSMHCGTDAKCSGTSCAQIDATCADPADCCTVICTSGKCAAIPNTLCKTLGEACTGGTACCSKTCVNNACVRASWCGAPNDICYDAFDCCNGICNKPAAGGPGTCAPSVSVSGATQCTMGGEPCVDGGSCCSRSCTDLGTGTPVCILGSGCHERGEICSKHEDCCGSKSSGVYCLLAQLSPPVGRCTQPQACQPVGNCCGAFGDNCRQSCCDGQKAVCRLDQSGLSRCFGGGGVCPDGYDGTDPACCIAEGQECQFRDQCCNLAPCIQVSGKYVCSNPTCVPAGNPCTPGSTGSDECCNGLSCLPSGAELGGNVCRIPTSLPDGGFPAPDAGEGVDAGPTCSSNGTACTSGSECCSGSCLNGTCGVCKTDGTQCTANAECCTNICLNGNCAPPQTCVSLGGTCSGTSECCYGTTCNVPAGQANGTCQTGATCGALGQACSTTQPCCLGQVCRNSANATCAAGDAYCTCKLAPM